MLLRPLEPVRWQPPSARVQRARRDRLSTPERRDLAAMLHQQFWCWGRDIHSRAGNLLIALGMTQHRATDGRIGGTRYTAADGSRHLWGFAICGRQHRTHWLLERFTLLPRVVLAPAGLLRAHGPEELPPTRRAHPTELSARCAWMASTARWIADYERGVARLAGIEHRRETLKRLESRACEAEEIVERWTRWSERFARLSFSTSTSDIGTSARLIPGSAIPLLAGAASAFSGSVRGR